MQGDQPISWLMFFTLVAAIFVAGGVFISFLRSRTNRHIAAEALEGNGSRAGATPNGAAPELIGVAVLALVVMALLTTGYRSKSNFETAQTTTPVGYTKGMAQPVGSADQPKVYQPANPAPDMRSAPTSSDTGVGPGTTGQPR